MGAVLLCQGQVGIDGRFGFRLIVPQGLLGKAGRDLIHPRAGDQIFFHHPAYKPPVCADLHLTPSIPFVQHPHGRAVPELAQRIRFPAGLCPQVKAIVGIGVAYHRQSGSVQLGGQLLGGAGQCGQIVRKQVEGQHTDPQGIGIHQSAGVQPEGTVQSFLFAVTGQPDELPFAVKRALEIHLMMLLIPF